MAHTRPFLSTCFAVAAVCVAAVSTTCSYAADRLIFAATSVRAWVSEFMWDVVATFKRPALWLAQRPVERIQACAYALRLAKRERPQVRDQWRMCPSC